MQTEQRTGLVPEAFDPAAIDPETREWNDRLEKLLAELPSLHTVEPHITRQAREDGGGAFGPIVRSDMAQDRTIPGPGGDLTLRVFVPETVNGVYLHIHGGGWVLGRAHHSDVRNESMARNANVAVVSVDYRLAPEDPYPAGPDDCEAAARWLVENAKSEFGSDRLTIGGESAGGHLSLVTLLRMRDRHSFTGFTGFAAANLVYGAYDLGMTPSQARWGNRNLILSTPIMQWFYDHFTPEERRREPDVSPMYADLTGMPPALFSVGTLDPLLDDSILMYARWLQAGCKGELALYPGGIHAFNALPIALAHRANAYMESFIKRAVED